MFGIFKKAKKAEKVNLSYIASVMQSRFWKAEEVAGKENEIVVHGKYRNRQQDFFKLFLQFSGENVKFKDQRGFVISEVPQSKLYPELKDIMNVL